MDDLTPFTLSHDKNTTYFKYVCSACGEDARNTYAEPHRSDMLSRRMCWNCNYWRDFEEKNDPSAMTIIDGHTYSPGSRTEGRMRGMAGRRFDIEYVPPSRHAGARITTFDLWAGSKVPDQLRAKFPDTAVFLGGATRAKVGETTCWDGSSAEQPPYPLPNTLR